ncbi:hypothetical protein [Brevundimonas sp.]|uniref:hypothetical protein n=1 Tax=Brevundimonas sp. TaxID=1871086 RepID=UPI002FCC1119
MTRKRVLSLEEELARIDREIDKLEQRARPLCDKLYPIQDRLRELRKTRQAKVAASAGGRAKRQARHDYDSAFRTYDTWTGSGALTQTAQRHGIPIRTFTWALAKRNTP